MLIAAWDNPPSHPHDARLLDAAVASRVERALAAPGVVAVGEIGLDYHYMNSPREDQIRALQWQLDLALEAGLPVVLHNRESWQDLEPMLAARSPGCEESATRSRRAPARGGAWWSSGLRSACPEW